MQPTKIKNVATILIIPVCIFAFALQLLFSCSGDNKKSKKVNNNQPNSTSAWLVKPPSSFSDTLKITTAAVVFYNSDSLQVEKIKLIYKPNIFESVTHENFYQMRNARTVLKKYWPRLHIIETSKARYLQFLKADKSSTIIDLNTVGDISGIFLFDPKKEPLLIDMMNIDTALGFYYTK